MMNVKKTKGRDEPIEDPALIREAIRSLQASETEFPIKVEGTSTLPYASVVRTVDWADGILLLKLVRPLPHELMKGAVFQALFAVEDQRYQALIVFQGRAEYLQYRFTFPTVLTHSDRRRGKRFPFRPRESAYVSAQDGGFPGLGVTGALANISMGGLALRVDRVLKLDDGLRLPPSTALFERGRTFPRIRVLDMPKLPILEVSGAVAHITEKGSELILGFAFTHLTEDTARQLQDALDFREKAFRASASPLADSGRGGAAARPADREASPAGDTAVSPSADPGPATSPLFAGADPLHLLARRSAPLMLAVGEGSLRDCILGFLRLHGYHRVTLVPTLEGVAAAWTGVEPPALVVTHLAMGSPTDVEPLASVRAIEKAIQAWGNHPTLIFCGTVDPAALMAVGRTTRLASLEVPGPEEAAALVDLIDRMAGLKV